MCQLIVKPAGRTISQETLRNAWQENDDGAGFAYRLGNQVYLSKGYFKFKKFYKAYRKHEHLDVMIHFRMATHGTKSAENCHPFEIGGGAVFAHNGILYKYQPVGADPRSDTRVFCDTMIKPLLVQSALTPDEYFGSPAVKAWLEYCHLGNKFAVLAPGGFYIFGEKSGEWKDNVWYSAGFPDTRVAWQKWANWNDESNWRREGKCWVRTWPHSNTTQTPIGMNETAPLELSQQEDRMLQEYDKSLQTSTQNWERCEQCNMEAKRLYNLAGDYVCYDCWAILRDAI